MTQKEPEFYVVWHPERGTPIKKHATEHNAKQEAARLAALHPGASFYVLRSHGRMITTRARRVD